MRQSFSQNDLLNLGCFRSLIFETEAPSLNGVEKDLFCLIVDLGFGLIFTLASESMAFWSSWRLPQTWKAK